MEIEAALRALNVPWLRRVRTYSITEMIDTLREALTTDRPGLKIIIADGECQLARQRRLRAENAERLARRQRVALPRFGVDDEICTGDHSCIRLSGCPSLTVKPNPDPLRDDPVATVDENCVGCGVCGEVAHAATLCPSFYRADRVRQSRPVGAHRRPPAPRGHRRDGWSPSMSAPVTLLIAALGGEGGGVLTGWIVDAARRAGLPVQATSIPGVAQRTGATTYYIEIWPEALASLGGRARFWRSARRRARSISCWPANCWRPPAPSRPAW